MVIFAAATTSSPTIPTCAPAQSRVDHFVAITCSDPNDSCDLYSDDCRSRAQLVSPSRDPIGYGDGLNVALFLHCGPLTGLDATGEGACGWPRIIIDPGESQNPGKCGSPHSQRWEFLLDRGNGKDRIKDAGYIVQKVTVECEQAEGECGHCGVPRRKSYSYFEAWYVEENDEKAHGTTVYTDMAWGTTPKQSCGALSQHGEVRFYSINKTGDLGRRGVRGLWEINQVYPQGATIGEECATTSGLLPSTGDTPSFWKNHMDPTRGMRLFTLNWNCCYGNWAKMTSRPGERVTNGKL